MIGGVLALALALYGAIWYHLSANLVKQATAAIAGENSAGKRASCENLAPDGFPVGLGLYCDSILFEDAKSGVSVSAGKLQSGWYVYNPLLVRTEIDSPAHLEYPGLVPLDLDWKTLAIAIRLGSPLPAEISISTSGLRLRAGEPATSSASSLATLQSGTAAMSPQGRNLDFTAALIGLSTRIGNRDAVLDLRADITVEDGVALFASRHDDLRGSSAKVRTLSLTTSDGGTIALSGPVSVDQNGYVNGQIMVNIEKAPALAANLAGMIPQAAGQIGTFIGLVAPPQSGGKGGILVQIVKGKIYAGFILIGEIPPLQTRK